MTNEKTLDKNPDDNLDQTNISDKEIKESEEKSSPEEVILNLEDKLTRSFAEMENQRRRFEKEKEDAFDYGGFTFAREALNLLDNLERSKESLQNDETLKNTDALKKISEHLNIIHNDMINIFKKNGIEPIIALNKKLDPNIHQAMIEIEDDNKDIGTIIKEIQKGFMMKDRLLRPSLVGVSTKTKKTDGEAKKDQENEEKKDKN